MRNRTLSPLVELFIKTEPRDEHHLALVVTVTAEGLEGPLATIMCGLRRSGRVGLAVSLVDIAAAVIEGSMNWSPFDIERLAPRELWLLG